MTNPGKQTETYAVANDAFLIMLLNRLFVLEALLT